MTDDPNSPVPVDPSAPDDSPDPANPFAGLQAELDNIGLDDLGQPKPVDAQAQPGAVQPQPHNQLSPMASPPVSSVAISATQAPTAPKMRLCPGCNSVQEFVDGRCVNCGQQLGSDAPSPVESAFEFAQPAYASQRSPMFWIALTLLALALLAVAGFFAYPMLTKPKAERTTSDASTDVAGAAAKKDAAANATIALKPVAIDDALKARISEAFRAGNKAWGAAGTKAYVYRYSIKEVNVAMKSQALTIEGYTGGPDASAATTDKAAPMADAFKDLLGDLSSNAGVTATLDLESGKSEPEAIGDIYVVFGKDFGQDHMDEIQPVIDSIENYKKSEGQYPLALDGTVMSGLRTKGNPQFTASGYGYIPIFRTDSSGNIVMGSGQGVKRMQPAQVSGYYLLRFLPHAGDGMDFYSQSDLNYYTQKISPFPYIPSTPVHNMPLTKDGKPDGVACVIKDGKLL